MLNFPNLDPVAIAIPEFTVFSQTIGPINVHWYGIMYLCGFTAAFLLGLYRAKKAWTPLERKQIEDLIFYAALGLVLGARVGYVIFYNFSDFIANPLWLLRVWEGGMSFHGGALGVMIAIAMFCRKYHKNFIDVWDFVVPLAPLGLGFGRFGNFIGQELWGRASDVSWAMVFPKDPDLIPRHPSQLYQVFTEGLLLFIILFWFSSKPRPRAVVSGLGLVVYGIFRFAVEFVREPDAHLGFVSFGWMTRGQQLCIPMVVVGAGLIIWGYRKNVFAPPSESGKEKGKKSNKQ